MLPRMLLICCACALALSPATSIRAADNQPPQPHTIQEMGAAGWKLPIMLYPRIAFVQYEQGNGQVELFTDAKGNVSRARMIKKIGYPSLDGGAVNWALAAWKGPPNSHAIVTITFRMH